MSFRNFLIRLAASTLYVLRRQTLRSGSTHMVVFTGTSGKTLARTAASYALTKAGKTVVSPPYGYTNELGIVLAALGIKRSVRLHSPTDLYHILTARPIKDSYVLIEIGADWRTDTLWLTKRFVLRGVCIADIACAEWVRSHAEIISDKKKLAGALTPDGFVCWNSTNPSTRELAVAIPSGTAFAATAHEKTINYASFDFAVSVPPAIYASAIGLATECLCSLGLCDALTNDYFLAYTPPSDRFSITTLPKGAALITDTYKSVPHCMERVLSFALSIPAKRRVAIVTPMHPVVLNTEQHYQKMGSLLSSFETVYLAGFTPLLVERLGLTKEYTQIEPLDLARILNLEDATGSVIVVKAAGRYGLEPLALRT